MTYAPWKSGALLYLAVLFGCGNSSVTVTVTGTNVTFTPASPVHAKVNATQAFTVTADAHDKLVSTVGGTCPAGSWSGSVYTTGKLAADCTVSFSAALETFSVSASGAHLTLSPAGVQTVASGSTQTFTVTPDTGYSTNSTVGGTCPAGSWTGSAYTTGAITGDCDVTFSATLDTYQVTATGTHVTIDPNAAQTVPLGGSQTFTVTPDAGYSLSMVVGGTCPAGSWNDQAYRTGAITSDCTVTFSADVIIHRVTATGTHVAINPASPQTVNDGATVAYTVTPDMGYTDASDVGGTCPPGTWSGTVYTTGAIVSDCSVTFSATLNTYQVTPSGASLVIDPAAPQTVNYGGTQTFTVTANPGYDVLTTVGGTCPAGGWSGDAYTTGAITTDCSVTFNAVPGTVIMAAGDAHVTITPSGAVRVVTGATQAFKVKPASGMAASFDAGGTCPAGTWTASNYTTGAVTADCSINFTSLTPILQPASWITSSSASNATTIFSNVTGATDTVAFNYAVTTGTLQTYTAGALAASNATIHFAWDFAGFHGTTNATAELDAFADGPSGTITVPLQPSSMVSGNFEFSGTASLTINSGYPFGVTATGQNGDASPTQGGTITLSTIDVSQN